MQVRIGFGEKQLMLLLLRLLLALLPWLLLMPLLLLLFGTLEYADAMIEAKNWFTCEHNKQ